MERRRMVITLHSRCRNVSEIRPQSLNQNMSMSNPRMHLTNLNSLKTRQRLTRRRSDKPPSRNPDAS